MEINNQWMVVHNNHYSPLIQVKDGRFYVMDFVFGTYVSCSNEKADVLINNGLPYNG